MSSLPKADSAEDTLVHLVLFFPAAAIKGAQGVTCQSGKCFVYSCEPGYTLDESYYRTNGGKGRCKRAVNPKRALA